MFRRFITLIFVATLSGTAGTGVGILIAPAEGAETRERVSAFVDEHGCTLIEGLERGDARWVTLSSSSPRACRPKTRRVRAV